MTAALLALTLLAADDRVTSAGLSLPAGFEARVFADSTLANDIHCMTIDPKGRVIVAGRGYVRILTEGKDGKAEKALEIAHALKEGANGLLWEEGDLWCVGDGGLRRFRDLEGAGKGRPSELVLKLKTGGEHMAHAVRRGPDGRLYVVCGDGALVPGAVGGCVLRLAEDLKSYEVVADGFRNVYAMDWDCDGDLYTFDSDNERCVSLPWYEYTRLYRVEKGGHHGWLGPTLTATWRKPPYFLDTVAPIATLGRGSPTGVACYRHTHFPKRYQGGLFLLDWTFGVVHFVAVEKAGRTCKGKPEVFARSVGTDGFAPTACAVHPKTGELFVSIGGRGTRGAVYRIRCSDRPAGEVLPIIPRKPDDRTAEKAIVEDANDPDPAARRTAARRLASLEKKEQGRIAKLLRTPLQRTALRLAFPDWDVADLVKDTKQPAGVRLDAVRLLQMKLGDIGAKSAKGTVWEGYTRRKPDGDMPDDVRKVVRAASPSGDANLDRELSRTLAMIEDDDAGALKKVAATLTARSHPTDDVHALIVLARLKAKRTAAVTKATADALVRLDEKIVARKMNRDTNWPARLAELHAGLAAKDAALNDAILSHKDFGRPDHVLWTRVRGFDREKAARIFLDKAKEEGFVWNASLVALVGEVPGESLPVLRKLWGEAGLDDEILLVLAKQANDEDHSRLLQGLTSPRLNLASPCLGALEKLQVKQARRADEGLALIKGLRQLPAGKEDDALRARFLARLNKVAGAKLTNLDTAVAWYAKLYPRQAKALESLDGVDEAAWAKRLAQIDWDKGDAKRGQLVYTKASCAACHSGSSALGPDLAGATKRFSRADLFTAILRPSKDVSPRYRTTQLMTDKGKVYTGIIAYDAVDSLILQTGPAETVRLDAARIASRRLTALSLMPTGLLDRLTDAEIADLYGYLASLADSKA